MSKCLYVSFIFINIVQENVSIESFSRKKLYQRFSNTHFSEKSTRTFSCFNLHAIFTKPVKETYSFEGTLRKNLAHSQWYQAVGKSFFSPRLFALLSMVQPSGKVNFVVMLGISGNSIRILILRVVSNSHDVHVCILKLSISRPDPDLFPKHKTKF